jgi:hypothetical protein
VATDTRSWDEVRAAAVQAVQDAAASEFAGAPILTGSAERIADAVLNVIGARPPHLPDAEAIRCYLRVTGWHETTRGVAGTLWHRRLPGERIASRIAIFHEMRPDGQEWRGVIDRLAKANGVTYGDQISAINHNQEVPGG